MERSDAVATLRWENRVDAPTEDEVLTQLDELATARGAADGA